MTVLYRICALVFAATLAACQPTLQSDLPIGSAAYETIDNQAVAQAMASYALRPGDKIGVQIYQEDGLSQEELVIDEAGMITMPLIGEVQAAGRSGSQLARAIEGAYRNGFLRNPQANVSLIEATPRTVSVEGQVKTAGVYPIRPGYTLLSALALAGSPLENAALDEVLLFRNVDGQRLGGRFDLTEVRAGRMDDPLLVSGDVVVVGYSRTRGMYRDMLQILPSIFGTLTSLTYNN